MQSVFKGLTEGINRKVNVLSYHTSQHILTERKIPIKY